MPRNTKTDMGLFIDGVLVARVNNTYSCRESHATAFHDSVWDGLVRLPGFKNNANRTYSDNMADFLVNVAPDRVSMSATVSLHPHVTPELLALVIAEVSELFGVQIVVESAPVVVSAITTRCAYELIITGGFAVMPAWWWIVAASRMFCCRALGGVASSSAFKDPLAVLNMDQVLDSKNTLANDMAFDSAAIQASAREVWNKVVKQGNDAPAYLYVARAFGPDSMSSWTGVL